MMYLLHARRDHRKGSKDYYRKELAQMGPMTYEEKVISFAFLRGRPCLLNPSTRSTSRAPISVAEFFAAFLHRRLAAVLLAGAVEKGETYLDPDAGAHFPITIIFIWPAWWRSAPS